MIKKLLIFFVFNCSNVFGLIDPMQVGLRDLNDNLIGLNKYFKPDTSDTKSTPDSSKKSDLLSQIQTGKKLKPVASIDTKKLNFYDNGLKDDFLIKASEYGDFAQDSFVSNLIVKIESNTQDETAKNFQNKAFEKFKEPNSTEQSKIQSKVKSDIESLKSQINKESNLSGSIEDIKISIKNLINFINEEKNKLLPAFKEKIKENIQTNLKFKKEFNESEINNFYTLLSTSLKENSNKIIEGLNKTINNQEETKKYIDSLSSELQSNTKKSLVNLNIKLNELKDEFLKNQSISSLKDTLQKTNDLKISFEELFKNIYYELDTKKNNNSNFWSMLELPLSKYNKKLNKFEDLQVIKTKNLPYFYSIYALTQEDLYRIFMNKINNDIQNLKLQKTPSNLSKELIINNFNKKLKEYIFSPISYDNEIYHTNILTEMMKDIKSNNLEEDLSKIIKLRSEYFKQLDQYESILKESLTKNKQETETAITLYEKSKSEVYLKYAYLSYQKEDALYEEMLQKIDKLNLEFKTALKNSGLENNLAMEVEKAFDEKMINIKKIFDLKARYKEIFGKIDLSELKQFEKFSNFIANNKKLKVMQKLNPKETKKTDPSEEDQDWD